VLDIIPEDETATQLHMAHETLRKHRKLGIGPPYVKIGRKFYYRPESLRAWVLEQERSPSAQSVPARRGRPPVHR
jgi:hypothetical protein